MPARYTVQQFLLTYGSWMSLMQRCVYNGRTRRDRASYKDRGIKVCRRWHKFENFLKDMGPREAKHLTLDRKNNAGHYTKSNCRWATPTQQAWNRRSTVMLTFRGKTMARSAWAREVGLSQWTLGLRLRQGWSVRKALTTPANAINPAYRTFAQGRTQGKKLTQAKVQLLVRLAREGATATAIGARLGVSNSAVCAVAKQFNIKFKKGRPKNAARSTT